MKRASSRHPLALALWSSAPPAAARCSPQATTEQYAASDGVNGRHRRRSTCATRHRRRARTATTATSSSTVVNTSDDDVDAQRRSSVDGGDERSTVDDRASTARTTVEPRHGEDGRAAPARGHRHAAGRRLCPCYFQSGDAEGSRAARCPCSTPACPSTPTSRRRRRRSSSGCRGSARRVDRAARPLTAEPRSGLEAVAEPAHRDEHAPARDGFCSIRERMRLMCTSSVLVSPK